MTRIRGVAAACLIVLAGCDQKGSPSDVATEEEPDGPDEPAGDLIRVTGQGGIAVPDTGTYHIPGDDHASTVAVFTRSPEMFSIENISTDPVVVNRILLDTSPGVADEEFTLRESDADDADVLVVEDVVVSPGSTFPFHVRFFPVSGGDRAAEIQITYETTATHTFTVTGTGSPEDLSLFSDGGPALHRLAGTPETDETVAGMAVDEEGASTIAGSATGIIDATASDVLLYGLDPDGRLAYGRIWHSSFAEGHGDRAAAVDGEGGSVYLAGTTSATVGNPDSGSIVLVLAADASTGEIAWDRLWNPVASPSAPSHAAAAHAIDATTTDLYVAGTTGADVSTERSHALILALDASTGDSILFQQAVDVGSGVDDVARAVRVSGTEAFIGGATGTDGFVLKLSAVDTASPVLDWAVRIGSAPVEGMDVDSSGDVYLACEGTAFTLLRLSGEDGSLVWGKTHASGSARTVHVASTSVFAGGTGEVDGYGPDDGLVLALSTSGDIDWAAFYFTGAADDQACSHDVAAIALRSDTLYLAGQVATGALNEDRYFGYWYDGPASLTDASPVLTDLSPTLVDMPSGVTRDAAPDRAYEEWPDTVLFGNAADRSGGTAPDADIFWQTIFI